MNPTREIYAELQTAYDVFNADLFGGTLPPCLITLQRRDSRSFGYFSSRRFGGRIDGVPITDEIALNPIKFKSHGPLEALQTLAHEMCHLWQAHHGKPSRKAYHNSEWADRMESIGLMPTSTGRPGGSRTGQQMADYAIPEGKFLVVATDLLDTRFKLAWYDRAEEIIAEHALELAADAAAVLGEPMDVPATATTKAKSKVAFACMSQGCKAKAWGKPSLHIVCGDHSQRMEPT